MSKKIAITGIDGCGKSTVINELIRRSQAKPSDYQVFACTNFHDTPNAPFHELSRTMDGLSQYADQLNDPTMKYAALYLKMTLYGAIESFYEDYYQPPFLIMERHPLVGALAYGSLYLKINEKLDLQRVSNWNEKLLEQKHIHWNTILHWFELENQRLGRSLDFWDLPSYLLDIQRQEPKLLLQSLKGLFRTDLPQQVIHFKIDNNLAATRVGQSKTKEIHESQKNLAYIDMAYTQALSFIERLGVAVTFLPVDTKSPDELADEVLLLIK